MKLREIVQPNYQGYVLQGYAESLLPIEEIRNRCTKLTQIPPKISAFIEKSSLKEAFKEDTFCYYILDTSDKVFVLDY